MKKRVIELLRIKHYYEKLIEYIRDGGLIEDFKEEGVPDPDFNLDTPMAYKANETPIRKPMVMSRKSNAQKERLQSA